MHKGLGTFTLIYDWKIHLVTSLSCVAIIAIFLSASMRELNFRFKNTIQSSFSRKNSWKVPSKTLQNYCLQISHPENIGLRNINYTWNEGWNNICLGLVLKYALKKVEKISLKKSFSNFLTKLSNISFWTKDDRNRAQWTDRILNEIAKTPTSLRYCEVWHVISIKKYILKSKESTS